jgi:hypothetical protein
MRERRRLSAVRIIIAILASSLALLGAIYLLERLATP